MTRYEDGDWDADPGGGFPVKLEHIDFLEPYLQEKVVWDFEAHAYFFEGYTELS